MTTYCKGCLAYQQVRGGDYRCANCPAVRKRKPRVAVLIDKITERALKRLAGHISRRK